MDSPQESTASPGVIGPCVGQRRSMFYHWHLAVLCGRITRSSWAWLHRIFFLARTVMPILSKQPPTERVPLRRSDSIFAACLCVILVLCS